MKEKTVNLFSSNDSESDEVVEQEEVKNNNEGFIAQIKNLAEVIISGILMIFIITFFTCIIAPIVAYILIFKLLREIFSHDYF